MATLHPCRLLVGLGLVACSGSAVIATSKLTDDASASAGGSGGASTGGGPAIGGAGGAAGSPDNGGTTTGSRGASASTGGTTNVVDASSSRDAGSCGNPSVSNFVQSLSDVPSDGCGSIGSPATCVGPPVTFSCPVVHGPGDSGTIRPGDQITVNIVATSDGTVNYPCFGLVADHGVMGGANLLYALPSTPWKFSVQIPPSLVPGTVIHFTAYVRSLSSLNAGSCPNRLGRADFDLTVE